MLLAMLIVWLAEGSPRYPSMEQGQRIAYEPPFSQRASYNNSHTPVIYQVKRHYRQRYALLGGMLIDPRDRCWGARAEATVHCGLLVTSSQVTKFWGDVLSSSQCDHDFL